MPVQGQVPVARLQPEVVKPMAVAVSSPWGVQALEFPAQVEDSVSSATRRMMASGDTDRRRHEDRSSLGCLDRRSYPVIAGSAVAVCFAASQWEVLPVQEAVEWLRLGAETDAVDAALDLPDRIPGFVRKELVP